MVWLNLTMLLCILWSSNCCESNTQIGRNPVFLNSLFCTCIPILFLSISYPCIVGILQFKWALTELLLLQIVVKENLAWFVPLLLHHRPPQLNCSNDRRVPHSKDPASGLSFAASDPVAMKTALPSSTEQMTSRTTRVRKRGRTLSCLLTLCIA